MKNVTLAYIMLETLEEEDLIGTAAYEEFINHQMVSINSENGNVYYFEEDDHDFVKNISDKMTCIYDLKNGGYDFFRVGSDEIEYFDILQEMINKQYASGVVVTDIHDYVETNKKEIVKTYYENLLNSIDNDEISIKLG